MKHETFKMSFMVNKLDGAVENATQDKVCQRAYRIDLTMLALWG